MKILSTSQLFILTFSLLLTINVSGENQVATLRGSAELTQEAVPPATPKVENDDLKRKRDYPQQPPTIPHDISRYQLDKNFNACMRCHSRKKADLAQAPAISITHYMTREGDFLAGLSPRRYYCTQCHVHQLKTKPLVQNDFIDMDELRQQGVK